MEVMNQSNKTPLLCRTSSVAKLSDVLTALGATLSAVRAGGFRGYFKAILVGLIAFSFSYSIEAQEAEWIWVTGSQKDQIEAGAECHFRKAFVVKNPEAAEMSVIADDNYEIYLNGKKVAEGGGPKQMDKYDIAKYVSKGKNLMAVKVVNADGKSAGLAIRLQVKEKGGKWVSFSTDKSWKTNDSALPLWYMPFYNDKRWTEAVAFGRLGNATPFDRAKSVPEKETTQHERFSVTNEFKVAKIVDHNECGSVIAFAFNEFGELIVSQEAGPLVLIQRGADDGSVKTKIICDQVKTCQGILSVNGELFVTGTGPQGLGLYRLTDENRDGTMEKVVRILAFTGSAGEHGPHGLAFGPDGLIYCMVGNHSKFDGELAQSSPVLKTYEGDTLTVKYEDPGGHAVGVKAPGGVVLRTDLDGKKVEMVAAGIRNSYDLAFNSHGELFAHDSDMEADIGMTWYRPTRVMHIVPGAEFGWRSGWSSWPEYYLDSVPSIVETGRGSPTGGVFYDHFMFPQKYHGCFFTGDWSEGRILAVTVKKSGASYTATSEVFLQGSPLNVTDLAVGPDGGLYFSTGGRGTAGAIYQVTWDGEIPDSIKKLDDDLVGVIRQPQLQEAWARQRIAAIKLKLGKTWSKQLKGVVLSTENPDYYRTRALDVMQLYGPAPDIKLLSTLSTDKNAAVRAKAAELLGLYEDSEAAIDLLKTLLADEDRNVRRKACEAYVRLDKIPAFEDLKRMLISEDRMESYAARKLLERIPREQWWSTMLETDNHRLFIQCAVAGITTDPTKKNAYDILSKTSEMLDRFISDRNFIDLLRVIELSLSLPSVNPDDVQAFGEKLGDEFPSGNSIMNRELARILAYMKITKPGSRYISYLNSETASDLDKTHVAMFLQTIRTGWTEEQKIGLITYLEKARKHEGGGSYPYYVMQAVRDFTKELSEKEVNTILANGDEWPDAAISAFYLLPANPTPAQIKFIKEIDRNIQDESDDDDSIKQLKIGIIAVLGRSGDEESMAYLRQIWDREPERRAMVAMGLAQKPEGDNWKYLIESLESLENEVAVEILQRLATVDKRPSDPNHYRQVIVSGLMLKDNGADAAITLLEHWVGEKLTLNEDPWETKLATWQEWFTKRFPELPVPSVPENLATQQWTTEELTKFLESDEGKKGDVEKGKAIYASAQCSNCHRFTNQGSSIGPDLTAVRKRFRTVEIVEAIVEPSKVISDQYKAQTIVTTTGQQFTGLVSLLSNGDYLVTLSTSQKVTIKKEEVEETVPSAVSAMPAGLLDSLTREEIASLFAYLDSNGKESLAEDKKELPTESARR